MPLVGLVHSTRLVIDAVHQVVSSKCPDATFIHVMDEGILRKLASEGQITPVVVQWLGDMVESAAKAGAELVVVSCSSLSPGVNRVRERVSIPVLKIDEPMVEHAVSEANRIGLVMTNPTTEAPSKLLCEEVCGRFGRTVELVPRLCPDAFAKLNRGDIQGHDDEVVRTVEDLLAETDVVMLAQISIARVKSQIDEAKRTRVYSSLDFIAPKVNAILAATGN